MELLMVLLFYIGVLVFCFWLGEKLRRLQTEMRAAPPTQAGQEPPGEPAEQPAEEQPAEDDSDEQPLEPELLPDPRQTAQELARNLEELAGELAGRLGMEFVSFSRVYPGEEAAKKPTAYTDLEEIVPQNLSEND